MLRGPGTDAADNGDVVKLRGDLREDAGIEVHALDHLGLETGGGDTVDELQVKGIGMRRGAREQDEDHVFGGVLCRYVLAPNELSVGVAG